MVRGIYQRIGELWKNPKNNIKELYRERLIKWRRELRFQRVEKPTRLDRARALGYKAKQGFVIVRARIKRGGRKRPLYGRRGRKPSKAGISKFTSKQSLQVLVEQRVNRKYPSLEVLNSYWVASDGKYSWFEIIMIDPNNPNIKKDKYLKWITEPQHRKRVFHGLTSSGKRARGLRT